MNKHILVISQYFYPEEFRINDICKEWVKKGYKVTVLTGIPNYPQGKFYDGYSFINKRNENYEGIEIIRIPLLPRGKKSVTLALNYISFVVSGFIWQLFTKLRADYVFIFEVSPMTQALPGVWYSKKVGVPCYLYVQDLWPDNVEIITGIKNKTFINLIGKMVDYIYRESTKVFATSESFVQAIVKRGIPVEKVEYWPQYAEDFYRPVEQTIVQEIPNDDVINVIFAGNIGVAQGLEILPKAAKIIKEISRKKVRFNIVGDGRYREEFISIVNKNQLEDMFNFVPKQPAIRIPEFMAASDIAFLSLTDNPIFEKTIPAKLQTYLACGIPIVASASGETKRIIIESKSGLCGLPGDENDLAKHIIELTEKTTKEIKEIRINARAYYENMFDKEMLLRSMDNYFSM